MNNGSTILAFSLGVAVGSVAVWKILKDKYHKMAQDEISEMREYYRNKEKTKKVYDAIIDSENYNTISEEIMEQNEKGGEEDVRVRKPYVIPPEEFGENDYETSSFTYYADGVLTDDNDEIVYDVENTIGSDSLTHFGEYEDDSVFVRNERLEIDYEILFDTRKYYDVNPDSPQSSEEE